MADLIGLGLPSSQTDRWDLVPRVEGIGFPAEKKTRSACMTDIPAILTYLVHSVPDILLL